MLSSEKRAFYTSCLVHLCLFICILISALLGRCSFKKDPYTFNLVALDSLDEKIEIKSEVKNPDKPPLVKSEKKEVKQEVVKKIEKPKPVKVEEPKKMSYEDFLKTQKVPVKKEVKTTQKETLSKKSIQEELTKALKLDSKDVVATSQGQGASVVRSYLMSLKRKIDDAWNKPELMVGNLEAVILFQVLLDGSFGKVTILESSGNSEFDQSIIKAFYNVSRVSAPPDGSSTFQLKFKSSV